MRAAGPATAVEVAPMTTVHWPAVREIYAAGIATGYATFETETPDWVAWDGSHLPEHRFVALDGGGGVLGWTAVSAVSGRCAYAGVVENSVYVHPRARGRGVGMALLKALITSTEGAGIWTLQTGIFPENTASLALHHRVGFRTVGIRRRLGRLDDRWRDVVLLERRSDTVD